MINTNVKIEQLQYMTLGQIAAATKQSKTLLNDMKHFKSETKNIELEIEQINAQDFIDSIDTKIKRPRF